MVILYSNDHPKHERVVNTFAILLREKCHCKVSVDLWCKAKNTVEKVNWLPREIEQADKIIMVVSEGSVKKAQCLLDRSQLNHSDQSEYNQDYFMQGYKFVLDNGCLGKVITVIFDYTPLKINKIPGFSKPCRLLGDMELFMQNLHDVTRLPNPLMAAARELLTKDMDASPQTDFQPLPNQPGSLLINAIADMVLIAQMNPEWFEKYHGFPIFDESSVVGREPPDSDTSSNERKSDNSQTELLPVSGGHNRLIPAQHDNQPLQDNNENHLLYNPPSDVGAYTNQKLYIGESGQISDPVLVTINSAIDDISDITSTGASEFERQCNEDFDHFAEIDVHVITGVGKT